MIRTIVIQIVILNDQIGLVHQIDITKAAAAAAPPVTTILITKIKARNIQTKNFTPRGEKANRSIEAMRIITNRAIVGKTRTVLSLASEQSAMILSQDSCRLWSDVIITMIQRPSITLTHLPNACGRMMVPRICTLSDSISAALIRQRRADPHRFALLKKRTKNTSVLRNQNADAWPQK